MFGVSPKGRSPHVRGRFSEEFEGKYRQSSVEPKEKRELESNQACGLHAASGLEQGEGVSVGVLENCKVSHCRDFLFCSDHLCTYACGFGGGFIDGVDGEIVDELFV